MKIKILKVAFYFMIGVWIGTLIVAFKTPQEILSPLAEVTPTPSPIEPLGWNDEIRALFPKDEAGTMISICLLEHKGRVGKYAMHWEKDETYSYGWCQINSVHRPMKMNDYEWIRYLEDPKNHAIETRKIFLSQGFEAWFNSYNKVK